MYQSGNPASLRSRGSLKRIGAEALGDTSLEANSLICPSVCRDADFIAYSLLPNRPRPTARDGIAIAPRLQAAAFDRNPTPQRAHSLADAARIASSVWQSEQIEEAVGANGLHATYDSFCLRSKRIGIAFSRFSFHSMKCFDKGFLEFHETSPSDDAILGRLSPVDPPQVILAMI